MFTLCLLNFVLQVSFLFCICMVVLSFLHCCDGFIVCAFVQAKRDPYRFRFTIEMFFVSPNIDHLCLQYGWNLFTSLSLIFGVHYHAILLFDGLTRFCVMRILQPCVLKKGCSKKGFKRPINRPLKYFRPKIEKNLKKAVGLLGQAVNSLK